jgi:NAD-dependent SIR2 family protein deacetylase
VLGGEKNSFSHKQHGALKLPCSYCHPGRDQMGFPAGAKCATCHPDDKVGTFPTRRVYKVRDYVVFSHERHKRASCTECHGIVYEQAVLVEHRPTTMKACVDCHRAKEATLVCAACHELGQ